MNKNDLVKCFYDSVNISEHILKAETEKAIESNKVYKENFVAKKKSVKQLYEDIFECCVVEENTTFNAAKKYLQYGKTAVLNFANPHNPGGGVHNGAMAQEECLCRSSNLYPCISNKNVVTDYYLYNKNMGHNFFSDRLIYTKGITVFKDDSDVPKIMPKRKWFNVDVITCAAPYIAKRKYTNKTALKELFKSRIRNIFEAALDNDVEVLVLGAFGCGAFKNPPEIVAKSFHEVIEENHYVNYFKKIVFAIKSSVNNDRFSVCSNISAFEVEFNGWSIQSIGKGMHFNTVNSKEMAEIYKITVDEELLVGDIVELKVSNNIVQIEKKNWKINESLGYTEYAGKNINSSSENLLLFAQEDVERIVKKASPEKRKGYYSKIENIMKKSPYKTWSENNPYKNKQFSILGDSISTLVGYNPKGYEIFYSGENCEKSGVKEMKDTWWGKVIDFFGGELLVNNSWSGSRVTKLKDKEQLFPSGCSDERTAALHINDVKPDVILVYLGTNDWAFGAKTVNDTRILGENSNELFDKAYDSMLKKLKSNYPESEIWCCTLCETHISKRPDFQFPHKYAGTHIEEYNDIIRKSASKNMCNLLDLYNYKMPYDSIDGSHPNADGMNTLATMMIREIGGKEIEQFMDCENNQHEFEVAELYCDATKYVCKKCGKSKIESKFKSTEFSNCGISNYGRILTVDKSPYIWDSSRMKIDDIDSFEISFGDLPIIHISYTGEKLTVCNRINGSRDGWMNLPDGFCDDKIVYLTVEQKAEIVEYIKKINFSDWKTEDNIRENYEMGAAGFCISNSFICTFKNGECFKCYEPKIEAFKQLVDFIKKYCDSSWLEPYYGETDGKEEGTALITEIYDLDAEYVRLPADVTSILYGDTIRLFDTDTNREIKIQKAKFDVGRSTECELQISNESISRFHASFYYESSAWFIMDRGSTNGTWLNGEHMQRGKKYQLKTNDEINFAMAKKVIFDKHERFEQPTGDTDAKALAFLEAGMATFAKSDHKDEVSLKLIIAALSDAPLYFSVEIDLEAMLGSVDPTKLKAGDTLHPTEDVKMRILTLTTENDVEFVPMFTSNDEVNKGPSASIIRFYPQDYLPKLVQMDKPVIINPFSENRFLLSKQLITEVLLPLVENKTKPQSEVVEHPADKYIGKTIDAKYEVLKLIGRGGFYTTYLVKDVRVNKVWAMKVCDKKNRHYSPAMKETILTEPYMMQKLNHPAIPKVVDIIEDEDSIFIVRDYIEGETLETIVRMYGAQPADKVIEWGKQMCSALSYLHSQNPPLIYRDMKPANVILKPDGTIKFIDFGIMRAYKPNQSSDTCCLGTKGYAAPEQFGGSQTDARTDIFGLGMTMFRLVTGINPTEPPYEIKPICLVNPNLPKGLEYIISKCTQPNPAERYQSCDELMEDLNNYMNLPKPKGIFGKLFGKK